MNQNEIKEILQTTKTIATVGLSANPEKDSHSIAEYLMQQGYRVIPVNPGAREILGQKAYPDVTSIPDPIDVVQIFRPPADVPPFVEQAIEKRAKVVWMQAGITNSAAALKAEKAGLKVVQDACMRVMHRMLIGPK